MKIKLLSHCLAGLCLIGIYDVPETLANVDAQNPALSQELATYLKPNFGCDLVVAYERLRQAPTQVGVAVPKYYVWFTAMREETVIVEGAARIAAQNDGTFSVLNVVSQREVLENPRQLSRIFPIALIPDIEERAGLSREE